MDRAGGRAVLVHLGRVWSDGDPFLLVDRGDAQAWRAQDDDYERLVVDGLARGEVEVAIGDGRGVLLGHEADEGTLEAFRFGERDLLALIARYADEPDFEALVRDAAAVEPSPMAGIEVHSGELVLLRSATPWAEAQVVTETASSAAPRDWGPVDTDALVVARSERDLRRRRDPRRPRAPRLRCLAHPGDVIGCFRGSTRPS